MARPCLVYDRNGVRKAVFHGFSDNNDKCVVEYKDGEVHKTMCYHVKFTDELYKDYFMEDRENGRK